MDEHQEEIIAKVKEFKIEFIDLMFSDLYGRSKSVTISPRELPDSLEVGKWFDGSSIEGFTRIHESDMLLLPDPSTFIQLPWLRDGRKAARIICDIYEPGRIPFEGAPRSVLRRIFNEAQKQGWTYNTGPELEFFLFNSKENPSFSDRAGYFDFSPQDFATEIRAVIASSLEKLGVRVEMSHHECAPSQHEIDIEYGPALRIADSILVSKQAIKTVASSKELHATFMPKPKFGIAGSGMHVHQSFFNEKGVNLFYDKEDEYHLSELAYQFLAGQLKYIREMAAILNPTVNSYKRLVRGFEAPVYVCWAQRNRSALIRVPRYSKGREKATRLELRCPDPSTNPYLAFAVMLAAGLQGIKEKLKPPKPVEEDVYEFDDSKLARFYIKTLPTDLGEALREFEESKFMKESLGNHVFTKYLELKKAEWTTFQRSITDWERDRYIDL